MISMELTAVEAWTRVLERARTLLPEQTFRLWLEKTEPIALSQDDLTVAAGSEFAAEWIEDKYGDFLADVAERLFQRRLNISFEADETKPRDTAELVSAVGAGRRKWSRPGQRQPTWAPRSTSGTSSTVL
jgi:chromosomal replication initiation ATPase DnaA